MHYRTAAISPREMTYLFLSAGIGAKNLLAPLQIEFFKILVTDGAILVLAGLSEFFLFRKAYITKDMIYDNLALIHPDRFEELVNDLGTRFGIREIKILRWAGSMRQKGLYEYRLCLKTCLIITWLRNKKG